MPDEELDDELDTQDLPDDAAVGATDDEELPDDPEALKALVAKTRADATRESKRLQREAERQKIRADENEAGKQHWYKEATRQQSNAIAKESATTTANGTKPAAPAGNLESALAGLDMADFVADEKGAVKFVQALVDRGVVVTPSQAKAMLDERVTQERSATSEETRAYQALVQEYDDMKDINSELSQEAYAEFDRVAQEKPHWKQHEILAEATRRAARTLNWTPEGQQSTTTRRQPADPRARLRTAQGGQPNRTAPGARPAVVTAEQRKAWLKTAGGEVPPEVLAKVAKTVAALERQRNRS